MPLPILPLLLGLAQTTPAPTPAPTPSPAPPEIAASADEGPIPLTPPGCLAVAGQLVRVADGARLLLASRADAASGDPRAQAIHADWQRRIDGVEATIAAIRANYPGGAADPELGGRLSRLSTQQVLAEGTRCAAPPPGSTTVAPATGATP